MAKQFVNCADCVYFDEERNKCELLYEEHPMDMHDVLPLEVTPEDGCTFGQRAETNDSEA